MQASAKPVLLALLVLPWLNPFSPGPTPAVVPLLFAWFCAAFIFGMIVQTARVAGVGSLTNLATRAWIISALLSATFGLLQYFDTTAAFDPWVNRAVLGEAFGNLRQRNHFATLTNIGLAALAYWTVGATAIQQASMPPQLSGVAVSRWHALFALLASALLAVGNAASSSRTGFFQLLMLIGMTWVWRRVALTRSQVGPSAVAWQSAHVQKVYLIALLAYGAASWTLPVLASLDPNATGILARFHDNGAACAGRLTLWSNVLHLITQKPWLGWGWGELDYAHFVTQYPGERFCDILDNAHNLPLHLAVELGIPFAVVMCALCLWAVARAQPWRETHPSRQLAWVVLALIGLHSLLEYPLWYGPFQMAVGVCVGILCCTPAAQEMRVQSQSPIKPFVPVTFAVLSITLVAYCAFAAWDYWRVSQLYVLPQERDPAYRDNTMDKVMASRLFHDQVLFAELTTEAITPSNAERLNAMAHQLLHFSPEPRVVEKLIESAMVLGRTDEATFFLRRYKAAFPDAYAVWVAQSARDETP